MSAEIVSIDKYKKTKKYGVFVSVRDINDQFAFAALIAEVLCVQVTKIEDPYLLSFMSGQRAIDIKDTRDEADSSALMANFKAQYHESIVQRLCDVEFVVRPVHS